MVKTSQNLAANLQESPGQESRAENKGPEAIRVSYADLMVLGNQVQEYLNLRQAAFRANFFNIALKSALGAAAGIIALGVLGSAGVLIVTGTSRVVAHFLGDKAWAGGLITGVFYSSLILVGSYLCIRMIQKKKAKAALLKYGALVGRTIR